MCNLKREWGRDDMVIIIDHFRAHFPKRSAGLNVCIY